MLLGFDAKLIFSVRRTVPFSESALCGDFPDQHRFGGVPTGLISFLWIC
jgi:hypothetical protein